jgi:pumilio RNA-binding family
MGFAPFHQHRPLTHLAMGHSRLLEQFRVGKSKKWWLRVSLRHQFPILMMSFMISQHMYGHMTKFCGDQHGSQFIQDKLETASNEEKDAIISELVCGGMLSLMTDMFGNYVSIFSFTQVSA